MIVVKPSLTYLSVRLCGLITQGHVVSTMVQPTCSKRRVSSTVAEKADLVQQPDATVGVGVDGVMHHGHCAVDAPAEAEALGGPDGDASGRHAAIVAAQPFDERAGVAVPLEWIVVVA